ncbi:MAG: rod shape-determining protein MreC [Candidatus Cloacimonetes bacterium]|nr:rod shape-determining protein MreC [Candidatus Cloacimonadota bacterium]MCF7814257.1 rod shape-determining protein MreC [Candidatus Cloacimonadota bacterium]MCF7868464.1 rod shape-determining protein MreC [Candidatus Cloacimonadota bacterium]MCF7883916.1 rod shape-determining protein MreC [Candidatus Cloacimonadota bacterium]
MKKKFLFFFYFALSLFLIIGGNEARQTKADFLSKTIFSPFVNSVNYIQSLFEVKQKNRLLSEQLAIQTKKIVNLENTIQEINNSKIEYDVENYSYVLADVVGFSGIYFERNLIVNKGILNDVLRNSPVVSNKGVVGKVITSSMNYSIILPLNNPAFKLSVMSKRNKLQGILESDIYGDSYMNLIKLGSDIAVGDTIITSNVSTIFPKGYPVGVITRLKESPDQVYMSAKLRPFVDPASLDQVIILQFTKDLKYENELKIN